MCNTNRILAEHVVFPNCQRVLGAAGRLGRQLKTHHRTVSVSWFNLNHCSRPPLFCTPPAYVQESQRRGRKQVSDRQQNSVEHAKKSKYSLLPNAAASSPNNEVQKLVHNASSTRWVGQSIRPYNSSTKQPPSQGRNAPQASMLSVLKS